MRISILLPVILLLDISVLVLGLLLLNIPVCLLGTLLLAVGLISIGLVDLNWAGCGHGVEHCEVIGELGLLVGRLSFVVYTLGVGASAGEAEQPPDKEEVEDSKGKPKGSEESIQELVALDIVVLDLVPLSPVCEDYCIEKYVPKKHGVYSVLKVVEAIKED